MRIAGLDFDVSKAQALIKASTYGSVANLPPITLTIAGEGGSTDPLIQALVYQWKQNLGVDVQVRELDPEVYYSDLSQEVDQMYSPAGLPIILIRKIFSIFYLVLGPVIITAVIPIRSLIL